MEARFTDRVWTLKELPSKIGRQCEMCDSWLEGQDMTELSAKILFLLLVSPFVVWGQQEQVQSNHAAEPTGPGIYYKSPTGFVKLEQIMIVGGGTKHMGRCSFPA